MTEDSPPAPPSPAEAIPSVAARLALYQRAGGIVTPILTAALAFFIGGLVVLATTGKNPLRTYHEIFNGTGLNWFLHVGSHKVGVPFTNSRVWFPWDTASIAGQNLQQTLILTVTLVLTGLAVAFAFRCGLFNIGGQGQYIVGSVVALQMGVWFASLSPVPHVLLAVTAAALAGAAWAGIAGLLRASVGAHEVITTIMLNWTALWIASYLVGFGGPLQDPKAGAVPVTKEVTPGAKLHVFWGSAVLQGLHIGFFVAVAALVVYWLVLTRSTLGYEVRAVGFNAEAARYGGINVARNYFLAMAISGLFAGLAGALDILGWQFRLDLTGIQTASQIAFMGIAVALLGRNTPVGVFLAAVLFAALINGTSTRNLDPAIFKPELAGNLTRIIQGLVVLFVGADLLIIYLWQLRRKLKLGRPRAAAQE
ncbi:MAG: ABC transporter permease [Actinobacteria bacterium]|nr:MAG: ABC transporter permease [Actinomycetota bacterium]